MKRWNEFTGGTDFIAGEFAHREGKFAGREKFAERVSSMVSLGFHRR
ncbi:hypothetical protein A2U01_0087603, partial [Trifolium medium]|nr:hypothetical protein [Trifolium medium]